MTYDAYLIVICNPKKNTVETVDIWAVPPWDHPEYCPDKLVYAAYRVDGYISFTTARKAMIREISDPASRYYTLYGHWHKRTEAERLAQQGGEQI